MPRPSLLICTVAIQRTTYALAAQGTDSVVELRVDASHPGPTIDRNIFGQFAEHLGNGVYGGI